MYSYHSILKCYNLLLFFSGAKLSIRWFCFFVLYLVAWFRCYIQNSFDHLTLLVNFGKYKLTLKLLHCLQRKILFLSVEKDFGAH